MKKLKLFFALFAMLALGVGNAWGAVANPYVHTFASGDVKTTAETAKELDGVTWSISSATYVGFDSTKGVQIGSSKKPQKTTAWTMSTPISSFGENIQVTKVEIAIATASSGGVTYTITAGDQNATATLGATTSVTTKSLDCSANPVSTGTLTISLLSTKSKAVYIKSVKVTYETASGTGETAIKTLQSIEVTPKTVDYETGDVFKFDGTCTATYSVTKNGEPQADETAVVTPTTVSTPDMSTAGTKEITVTYTEDEVTVTDTYEINVTENVVTPGEYTGNLNNVFFGCATGNNATEQSGKFDDVLVVAGCTSSASDKTNYQSGHVRFYKDSYLQLSVPAGYVIKSIVFTADGTWNGSITASAGTYDNNSKTWTGNAQEVKFSFAAQNRIKSVKVTYAADVKYALNITTPSNGTLVVKDGSAVLADGAEVYEGTKLVVTPTPNAGYVFESLTVGGEAVELTDGTYTFNMPATNVTIAATFKENEKPAATLTLSKNGVTEDITGYKQDDKVTLPSITSDCVKAFVGWSADANCATEPKYKAGDEYTLASTTQILYAVYATVGGGGEATASVNMATYATANSWGSTSSTNQKQITINSDVKAVISAGGNSGKYYSDGVRIYQSESATVTISTTVGELKSVKFTFTNSSDGTLLYGSTKLTSNTAVAVNGTSAVFSVSDTHATENKGQIRFTAIEVVYTGGVSYSNYSTTCAAAPKAEVNPTAVTATAAGVEGKVTVTYKNVNTANVSVALFNDAACTEAFTADWLTASLDGDKNIAYTVAATTLYTERKAYIQLTAPETTGATDPDVVVIPVTQAAKEKVFASLAELVAADLTKDDAVTVTLTNDVIKEFYIYSSKRCGVVFDVQKDGKDIKIYFNSQTTIDDWAVGGKLSGTLTNIKWTTYSSAWQLAPDYNTWAWANLTYTEPKAVSTVVVSGAPTKTTYVDGEAFDPAGLTVTVNYNDASTEVNPTGVTFAVTPATLTKGQTSVNVTATYNSISSAAYEVTGLTVNDIPTKTVAEFIASEGGRCYLEGIVSNITNTTYGNFDLKDASGKIYIYGCLDASGVAQKFATLGVKEGDKIKVIADVYELYQDTKQEAKNVQYVSHISAASITIADITMEVGETKTIAATVVPAEAEVTYTIKENTDNAISLSGKTITALAEGTATITATVAEGVTYLSNSVDFKVTVTPKSEKTNVVILAEYKDKWYALVAAKGSANNTLGAVEVNYVNGKLLDVSVENQALITWSRSISGETATFKNGENYLTGGTKVDLTLATSEFKWNIDGENYLSDGNTRTFLFQGSYFKNYAISNAGKTSNGTTYSAMPIVIEPEFATTSVLRADLYDGKWGTFCPDQKVTYMQGASFYTLTYLEMKDGMPYKLFFDEITTDYLEAGKPYLFIAEGEEIKGVKSGEVVNSASNYNGFYGNVSGNTISLTTTQTEYVADGDVVNNYGVINSRFTLLGNGTNVAHERAHVQIKNGQLDCPNPPASLPALAPGARRVVAGATGINTATGVDQVQGDNVPTKMIINGQLFILRGEKMYDAQGKLVK